MWIRVFLLIPQNCPFTSTHAHGMCTHVTCTTITEKLDNYEGLILAHEVLIHSGKQRGSHGQRKYVCGVWGWGTMRKKEGGGKRGILRTLREDYHIALHFRKSSSSQELKVLFLFLCILGPLLFLLVFCV